jgi:hypothetical protein
MSLYDAPLVLKRLRGRRCVKGLEQLEDGEHVFCRRCAGSLYEPGVLGQLKTQLEFLVQGLLAGSKEVREAVDEDDGVSTQLTGLFAALLRKGTDSLEWFLHAYIYLFWGKLKFDQRCSGMQNADLYWMAKGAPQATTPIRSILDSAIERLGREGVEVDLAAIDEATETLWLIEIKRGDLDDRAVGQMLRYFDRAVRCFGTREFRAANINFVRPIVLLETVDPRKWITMPLHFREILDIYSFRSEPVGVPVAFRSVRRQMLSCRFDE